MASYTMVRCVDRSVAVVVAFRIFGPRVPNAEIAGEVAAMSLEFRDPKFGIDVLLGHSPAELREIAALGYRILRGADRDHPAPPTPEWT